MLVSSLAAVVKVEVEVGSGLLTAVSKWTDDSTDDGELLFSNAGELTDDNLSFFHVSSPNALRKWVSTTFCTLGGGNGLLSLLLPSFELLVILVSSLAFAGDSQLIRLLVATAAGCFILLCCR